MYKEKKYIHVKTMLHNISPYIYSISKFIFFALPSLFAKKVNNVCVYKHK